MSTVAPNVHCLHSVPRTPCVADMKPGEEFIAPGLCDSVLALLTHAQIDISDVEKIWCVIVASQSGSSDRVGAIVPLPRNAPVQRLQLAHAPQYALVA